MLSSAGWDGFIYLFILEDHFVVKERQKIYLPINQVFCCVYLTEIK